MGNLKSKEEYESTMAHSFITAEELKSKLDSNEPLMVFDIGTMERYQKQHIPGSACAVCNEDSKRDIMPRLPRDIEIVLVSDNDDYPTQIAEMMRSMGLNARYLKGGVKAWKWEFKESADKNISPKELKRSLDVGKEKKEASIFLLDVREPEEFKQWSIEGSISIPLTDLLSEQKTLDKIPKDKTIITICPHGNRATIAKYFLERYGYNVRSLEGGLKAWSTALEHTYKEFVLSKNLVKVVQLRRIGKGCISYIVESDGESAVIDPVFPIEDYIRIADKQLNSKITKVFDTHQHADHVSAAQFLAERTDGEWYQSSYENYNLNQEEEERSLLRRNEVYDGDSYRLGSINIKAIHTAGHTRGSISFLIEDKTSTDDTSSTTNNNTNAQRLLFTGDTIFVNGIGRPDLRDRAKEFAELLYDTLHNNILLLPKDTIILPGHFDHDLQMDELIATTIEDIKQDNILLRYQKEDFVKSIVAIVMPTPPNYKEIISINKFERKLPITINEIYELEIGPNRCSISNVQQQQ
jgi:glyoxylase-like metal-dependent hydrolase (beta-lactamase superfamily II)/rhodanese-related sulfurtransferase